LRRLMTLRRGRMVFHRDCGAEHFLFQVSSKGVVIPKGGWQRGENHILGIGTTKRRGRRTSFRKKTLAPSKEKRGWEHVTNRGWAGTLNEERKYVQPI